MQVVSGPSVRKRARSEIVDSLKEDDNVVLQEIRHTGCQQLPDGNLLRRNSDNLDWRVSVNYLIASTKSDSGRLSSFSKSGHRPCRYVQRYASRNPVLRNNEMSDFSL